MKRSHRIKKTYDTEKGGWDWTQVDKREYCVGGNLLINWSSLAVLRGWV